MSRVEYPRFQAHRLRFLGDRRAADAASTGDWNIRKSSDDASLFTSLQNNTAPRFWNAETPQTTTVPRTMARRKQQHVLDSASKRAEKPEFSSAVPHTKCRESPSRRAGKVEGGLTLKELMHFIGELYATKRAADQKCRNSKVPRLTMEQHMYVYLSHKYGLPNVVQAVSSDILLAVKKYIKPEFVNFIDVRVFALILANRLDEEFAVVIERLELVALDYCSRACRQRPETDRTSKHTILACEAPDILRGLYTKEDATNVFDQICKVANKSAGEIDSSSPATMKVTDANPRTLPFSRPPRPFESISVAEFVNACKSFQLDSREQFVAPIIQKFKNLPQMKPGIISTENAEKLLTDLDVPVTRIPTLLNFIDCHNTRSITFSECVYAMMIQKSPDFDV